MSIVRKTVATAAAGALVALLGLGGAALAQTTPSAQPAPAAKTTAPAPAAKASHHKKNHVKTHHHHRAKGMTKSTTKGEKTGATPSTGAAPATKN
jgi:hypothetical protein